MNEKDEDLVEVAEVGPRFHVEAKLLLKVTTKANLQGREKSLLFSVLVGATLQSWEYIN